MARSAMLFAPPQLPLTLPVEGEVIIGRSRGADLRLIDPDTSRQHARIVCAKTGCVVHDLKSTNGTWVNGTRVETLALSPGDRIQIGSHEIVFCEVEADASLILDAGDDAQTQLVERSSGESFRGDLAQIPPFAVLQILEMGRKTGVLSLDSDRGFGRLWLRAGDPIHAETKGQVGFDAAVSLVHARTGRFGFEPDTRPPKQSTIEATVTQLLLEASRLFDEGLIS